MTMISIKQILNESVSIYGCQVLIKTEADINKVFVYNEIRALKGVVVVTVEQNDYLESRATDQYEYSLLHIKYIARTKPLEEINRIKTDALINTNIKGLLQFIPRIKTIKQIGEY